VAKEDVRPSIQEKKPVQEDKRLSIKKDELDKPLLKQTVKEEPSKLDLSIKDKGDEDLENIMRDLDLKTTPVVAVPEKPPRAKPIQTERPKAVAVITPSKIVTAKKTTRPDFIDSELLWSAITQLPRGLPSWFTGREMDDIVNDLMNAEYREIEDEIHVKLGRDWYYGDPRRLGEYLQRIRK